MAGSKDKDDGRSGMIAAKVEVPPEEFRRILSDAWRSEITEELWRRIKGLLPGGGLISVGALTAVGGIVWGLLVGTVQNQVSTATGAAVASLQPDIQRIARQEAADAVKADIANVEAVRGRVRESVREMMAQALTDPAIIADIQRHARAATTEQLNDARWRREIERSVMEQQAGDTNLAPLLRLFALTDLLLDAEGRAIAVRILAENAALVPPPGLAGDSEEARFVSQGVATYVNRLARLAEPAPGRAALPDSFPANQELLRRLAEKIPEPVQPGNAFERLMHRFDSPLALRWLAGRTREVTGAQRALALQALLTHPAPEARERFVALLCAGDPQLRPDVLRAAAARPDTLSGDADGVQFAYLVRCAEDTLEARRVPRLDLSCLPGGDLLVPWQLSLLLGQTDRAAATAQRNPRGDLEAALRRAGPGCEAAVAVLRASATLRTPLGWSTLGTATPETGRAAPLSGLGGLLPAGAPGSPPAWVPLVATASGAMAGPVAAPDRHVAHVSLLIERLAALPDEMEGVAPAMGRLAAALAAAPVQAGRPAERLLLEAMASGGQPACEAALQSFAVAPGAAAAAPAALGESLACLRRGRELPAVHNAAALAALVAAVGRGPAERAGAHRAVLAMALGLGLADARAPAALMAWVLRLPADTDPQQTAAALEALLALEGPAILAGVFEGAAREPLDRLQGRLRDRPRAFAPIAQAAPYLEPGFAARVAAAGRPLPAGGRHWTTMRVATPAEFTLAADPAAVLLRAQPLAVMTLDAEGETLETRRLQPGDYLIGMLQPDALTRIARRPAAPDVTGLLGPAEAAPLPLGTSLRSRIGPDGPRLFPFVLEAGRSYEFRTLRLDDTLDTVIALLDARGNELPEASNDDEATGVLASRLCVAAPAGGLHWLRIENYGGPPRQPLGFEFRVVAKDCPPRR